MSTPHTVDRGRASIPPDWALQDTQPLDLPPTASPPGGLGGEPDHRRRRWIWLAVIAAAVLALVVPLLTYAIVRSGSDSEPAAAPSPTGPAPTPTAAPTAAVPDGRIPLTVLRDATIFVPRWPSDALRVGPSGWVTFTDGVSEPRAGTDIPLRLIGDPAYGDVDRDGAQETVITILAGNEGGSWQVLALDRDAKAKIVTLGRVVATTRQIKTISDDVSVQANRNVQIEVADFMVCCGEDYTIPQWQTRTFAWRFGQFVQVDGLTRFPYNPRVTELSITGKDVVLAGPVDGVRHGVLRVTVTTLEPVAPHHLNVIVQMPADLIREGGGWTGARVEPQDHGMVWVYLDLPAPAVGTSRTYALDLARAVDAGDGNQIGVVVGGRTSENLGFGEANPDDNVISVRIRTTG